MEKTEIWAQNKNSIFKKLTWDSQKWNFRFLKFLFSDFWLSILFWIWIEYVLKSLHMERQIACCRLSGRNRNRDFGRNLVILDENFQKSTKNDSTKIFCGSNPCPILSFSLPKRPSIINVCVDNGFEHSSRIMVQISKLLQMDPEIDPTFFGKVHKHDSSEWPQSSNYQHTQIWRKWRKMISEKCLETTFFLFFAFVNKIKKFSMENFWAKIFFLKLHEL